MQLYLTDDTDAFAKDVSLVDKQAHSTRWLGYGSICARVEMTSLADVNVDEAAQRAAA
jgi:hypothetical protein